MKKILIIDDDPDILEVVQLVLMSEGYQTETLSNGGQTYEKVADFLPDLIVLDVLLSGDDGRKICFNLKNDTRFAHIPIIMISAHPGAKETIGEYGADNFVPKPFSIADLVGTVEMYIA